MEHNPTLLCTKLVIHVSLLEKVMGLSGKQGVDMVQPWGVPVPIQPQTCSSEELPSVGPGEWEELSWECQCG